MITKIYKVGFEENLTSMQESIIHHNRLTILSFNDNTIVDIEPRIDLCKSFISIL